MGLLSDCLSGRRRVDRVELILYLGDYGCHHGTVPSSTSPAIPVLLGSASTLTGTFLSVEITPLNVGLPPDAIVIVEGIDVATNVFAPQTLVSVATMGDVVFWSDANTVEAGRAYASYRGSIPWPSAIQALIVTANTTLGGPFGISVWGSIVSAGPRYSLPV